MGAYATVNKCTVCESLEKAHIDKGFIFAEIPLDWSIGITILERHLKN